MFKLFERYFFPVRLSSAWTSPTQRYLQRFAYLWSNLNHNMVWGKSKIQTIFIDQPQCWKSWSTRECVARLHYHDSFVTLAAASAVVPFQTLLRHYTCLLRMLSMTSWCLVPFMAPVITGNFFRDEKHNLDISAKRTFTHWDLWWPHYSCYGFVSWSLCLTQYVLQRPADEEDRKL